MNRYRRGILKRKKTEAESKEDGQYYRQHGRYLISLSPKQ
jgi:hypothetical protein